LTRHTPKQRTTAAGDVRDFTEILQPGDKVLLHPPDTVKDGAKVEERGH
jgi:hypothetical protein